MKFSVFKNTVLLFVLVLISCGNVRKTEEGRTKTEVDILKKLKIDTNVVVGANQVELYLPLLRGKRVGIVANQTSVIKKPMKNIKAIFTDYVPNKNLKINANIFVHLIDSLVVLNIDVKTVFAPEHGFRGTADAGEVVKNGIDTKTGIPIISLYGKNKKPSKEQLEDLDVVVFDIQDVGARFYTY